MMTSGAWLAFIFGHPGNHGKGFVFILKRSPRELSIFDGGEVHQLYLGAVA
jgi:hypothetical protein